MAYRVRLGAVVLGRMLLASGWFWGVWMGEAAFGAEIVGFNQWDTGCPYGVTELHAGAAVCCGELPEVCGDLKAFSKGKKPGRWAQAEEPSLGRCSAQGSWMKSVFFNPNKQQPGGPQGGQSMKGPFPPRRYAYALPKQLNFFDLVKALGDLQWRGG